MTITTINSVKIRLAEIARTVSGITRAYDEAPQSLPPSDLPIFCSFVGPVTGFNKLGAQMGEETRIFLLRLFVKPVQQGYDGEAEKAVEPFLTSLRDTFLSHPIMGLGTAGALIPFVQVVTWLGDGGIAVLPYGGVNFLGAEFRLSVTILVPIGVAKYE
jgi:hypothetical protein